MPRHTPNRPDVEVPSLMGLPVIEAHDTALDAGLLAVDQEPAHTPTHPGVVIGQNPPPGAWVPASQEIKIWVSNGAGPPEDGHGGGGDQPVPPSPVPLAGAKSV